MLDRSWGRGGGGDEWHKGTPRLGHPRLSSALKRLRLQSHGPNEKAESDVLD